MTRKIIMIAVIASVLIIGIADAIALIQGSDNTLSQLVYDSAKKSPIIPFLVGLVCGHFFWPMYGSTEDSPSKSS